MLAALNSFISSNKLFSNKDNILVTVSGGMDSVILCHLFSEAKINFGIAHCNFELRGKESDGDAIFVKQLAKKYNVSFFVNHFDTNTYAAEKNISIQMAARELRYTWFEEIRKKNKYSFIATAHHKGDVAETMLINLTRGTGIHGLHGISMKQNKIIRPLLFATREDITSYAKQNNLKWREDSSNTSDKYIRNNIRLNIIPQLKKINPSLEESLYQTAQQMNQAEQVLNKKINECKKEVLEKKESNTVISFKKLKSYEPVEFFLFEILKEFGFNGDAVKKIAAGFAGGTGKQFFSETYSGLIDRDNLIIHRLVKKGSHAYSFTKDSDSIKTPLVLQFKKVKRTANFAVPKSKKTIGFDYDKLAEKLTIRKWKNGDFFVPLGMRGNKKLSDFFVDNKFSLLDKENTWLMLSGNDIIWVIGHRIDDRYKVTDLTKNILICELSS